MEQLKQFLGDLSARTVSVRHQRRLTFASEVEELEYEEALAISLVCFLLSMVAFSSVYSMCKARRAREGMGYREVQRPENSFEMMSLGGRDGVSMVLPQGY
ncbi:expressed unknown protein [Ectocarpus siliculosus]|uniref:Uncharacterized protein n=1 Tax=Ectocarpus siliculosus TaxID=2880 RepID=D7G2N5_ECTSI|nr:expressed unknown protein [Ectocarpus siliculosus]|eukprot:CBJ26860.1 expressed unknown protein [Ectocarpus siliculosus]